MIPKKPMAVFLSGAMFLTSCPVFATENIAPIDTTSAMKNDFLQSMFEKGFTFNASSDDLATLPNTKLDIFYGNNLNIALKEGLEFILSSEESEFLDKKASLNSNILRNKAVCDYIAQTIDCISDETLTEKDKQTEVLKSLTKLHLSLVADNSIDTTNGFLRFVRAMKTAYQTILVRDVAEKILTENRGTVETKMGSENISRSVGGSASVPINATKLGFSADFKTNEGSSETSFYKIDDSGNIGVKFSAGLGKYFSVSGGYDFALTHTLIFNSLEQFLDTHKLEGKISTIELREPTIKKIIESRQEMQNIEKQLLASMQTSIEWYLKMAAIVPQSTIFEWPDVTFASAANTQKTMAHTGTISAAADCFAKLGMNVSVNHETVTDSVKHSYLGLLEPDCSVSYYGGSAEQIGAFFKQDKIKKYAEIKTYVQNSVTSEPLAPGALSVIVSNVLGDIKHYNANLAILADETVSEEKRELADDIKYEIEANWLGRNIFSFKNKGRLEMLKTAISTAAYLRQYAKTDEEIALFKKLYSEIEHLAKMQVFSKNSLKQKAQFGTERKTSINSVSGKVNFKTPYTSVGEILVTYSNSKGEASFDTGEDISVQIKTPIYQNSLVGEFALKSKFQELKAKLANQKHKAVAPVLNVALSYIDTNFDKIVSELGLTSLLKAPTTIVTDNYTTLNFYLTKINKTVTPSDLTALPGETVALTKLNDEWVLKLKKSVNATSKQVKVGAGDYVSLSANELSSSGTSKIGTDTLTFVTNKYNAFAAGINKKSASENYLWNKFKLGQADGLKELFKNINSITKNSRYELQDIWNSAMKNICVDSKISLEKKEKLEKKSEKIFQEFLDACNDLTTKDTPENFEKALLAFDEVLKTNYKLNYLAEIERIHRLH